MDRSDACVRPLWRWILVACVVLSLVGSYVLTNEVFFRGTMIEFGDFANNAIQIRSAKSFGEIYGPPSRWGWRHTGPGFTYLYAWGELLLFDWLRLVGSPLGAHMLASLVFQVGCSVAAVGYALRKIGLLSALPLAVAGLVVHWHLMPGAPLSIWPPHVMFGPMLLLIAFGAGLASGDKWALPVVVFAGVMLVHNHVAQPLMVVPIFALAFMAWILTTGIRSAPGPLVVSAAILAVSVLPLAIDASYGASSNLAALLRHIKDHQGERHSIEQGIGYTLSLMRYQLAGQAPLVPDNFSLPAFAGAFGWWWIAVLLPLAGAVAALFSRVLYLRWYAAMFLLAVALSILWATIQDGVMYDFNGNFFYAVMFAGYLLPAMLLLRPFAEQRLVMILVGLATMAVAIATSPKQPFDFYKDAPEFVAALSQMARGLTCADVEYGGQDAIEGAAVVNNLDRLGVPFRVSPGYAFYLYPRGYVPPTGDCTKIQVGGKPGIPVPKIGGREQQVYVSLPSETRMHQAITTSFAM